MSRIKLKASWWKDSVTFDDDMNRMLMELLRRYRNASK